MKRLLMFFALLLLILVSACGNNETNAGTSEDTPEANSSEESKSEESNTDSSSDTFTYESENGPVELPKEPKRVVALYFGGSILSLDANIVGVDSWTKNSPLFRDKLTDAQVVTEEDLEKIIELDPDVIIGLSSMKNIDQLKEIAPTVTFTYGKLDYLEQHIEIGKVLNKEEEAKNWVKDFQKRAQSAGDEIRAKIGEDATVSVVETFDKQLYVFGDNWARGTEILYQEMNLKMPEKVKEDALEPGYFAISPEVLPEYAGDYIILSKEPGSETSFEETETFKNIPAVKNNQLFVADANKFYFNDPITLEYQLQFFKDHFLK
ncbi:iron-hydroxamate ABC transporter substrate-binding protein [Filobacillus milosensis]|uniref:Iron-hydroxamate ABC transporter substrate-binding protein n=1 Tax=Filobacillus milosensis TaxID=94137 RepID=A0A4Y8IKV8_9BACI|nr:iron-hydroxamate ABC transporter substrate-binding protein [Filobacillus milosensis]TFB21770.1 iron-hydroxamate ABC transporter substrate-binding protein [Filobacillus milosensis]